MKKHVLLLAFLMMCALPAQAQFLADSLFVLEWISEPGEGAAFDLGEFTGTRFDATGDGISDMITVEDNENGNPILMHVTDLKKNEHVLTIDIAAIRQHLFADGFDTASISALKFEGFYNWTTGLNTALFSVANSPVIYDPQNGSIFSDMDFTDGIVADFDEDGFPELVVEEKTLRQIHVYSSVFKASAD